MPSNDTRRVLKEFGIAVTTFEDLIDQQDSSEDVAKAQSEMSARLEEVQALIDRLQAKRKR